MLNSKQIRQIFNVTNQTLFNWRKSGKLPYIDIGSKGYLYKRSDIMNILGLKEEKTNIKRKNIMYYFYIKLVYYTSIIRISK